nr:hypothetical protein [Microbispora cellulosiformans]
MADLQMEGREQLALELFGQLSDLRLQHGDHVEQVGLVVARGRIPLGIGKLLRLGPALAFQLREAGPQTLAERVVRVGVLDLSDQPVLLPRDLGDALLERTAPRLPLLLRLAAVLRQVGGEKLMPLLAEDASLKQIMNCVNKHVFANADNLWVARETVLPAVMVTVGLAHVVGVLGLAARLGLAEHAPVTKIAMDEGTQQVRSARLRVPVELSTGTRRVARPADLLGALVDLPGDQRLMGRLLGPDPGAGRVQHAAVRASAAGGCLPIPHHVTGVLRVEQDLPDPGPRPGITSPEVRVQRLRRWIALMVRVEPIGDVAIPQPFHHPPYEDLRDGRATQRVGHQPGLALAVRRLGRDRMRDLLRLVAVRRAPDVPALLGMGAEAVPGRLHHLDGVPLGDALLDPAGEDGRGTFAVERDRLVGREESDPELFELMLDLRPIERAARDPVDGLANDRVEPAVRPGGFRQQVLNPAIPRNGNREALVGGAVAAVFQVLAARLDVVEVSDDQGAGRQCRPAVAELTRQRERRVL